MTSELEKATSLLNVSLQSAAQVLNRSPHEIVDKHGEEKLSELVQKYKALKTEANHLKENDQNEPDESVIEKEAALRQRVTLFEQSVRVLIGYEKRTRADE